VSSQASGAKRRPQRGSAVSAVKDTRVATSSITSHASRQHGRRLQLAEPTGRKDDHAPLVCAAAETKNSLTIRLQIVPSKKERLSLHLRLFSSLEGVVRVNLDVFEHEITSDTIGKADRENREKSANAILVKARYHARLGLFRTKKKNHTMKTHSQKILSTSYGVKTPLDGNEKNFSATRSLKNLMDFTRHMNTKK